MSKIIVAGAGGAHSEGVINSLLEAELQIIGIGCDKVDLMLSKAHKKYLVPHASHPNYKQALFEILKLEQPNMVHFQNDLEISIASGFREEIHELGVKTFLPRKEVIDVCIDKFKSWQKFRDAGILVPDNLKINSENDLRNAFELLGNVDGAIWLRSSMVGGGGLGSLPTSDFNFAKGWIDHFKGWGNFIAAEMLTARTVTWLSIWQNGELIVAQSRERYGWIHGNRAISGITGVTKMGVTMSDKVIDEVALKSIFAVDSVPHGIYGVDMAYDVNGVPNPTEINIARFFTTILFFTRAGLNFPQIFVDLALHNKRPYIDKIICPLPNKLAWIRGMDCIPSIFRLEDFDSLQTID